MSVAIDTNILLDILLNDKEFYNSSKEAIEQYNSLGALIISPIVYAELLTQFIKQFSISAEQKLNQFLKELGISLVNFTNKDLITASEAWNEYIKNIKNKEIFCIACGEKNNFFCKKCKQKIFWRNHIIADFLIGSHAQNNTDVFLTRDRGFYKSYFKVKLAEN